MYNWFLEHLLDNSPEKTLSGRGMKFRKAISPMLRGVMPFTTATKLKIISRAKIPKDEPIIYAASHGFREDVEDTVITVGRQAYILIGSLAQIFKTVDGVVAWMNGMILVDRTDKISRQASKDKMERVLSMGGNIIMYPEGTWNTSPNKLMGGLFPGVYDIAANTRVRVAPVVTHRDGKYVYSALGAPFEIWKYERDEGVRRLRDKMATLKWKLMEKAPAAKRLDFPVGKEADAYWGKYIDALKDEVTHFEHELEDNAVFRPKGIFHREEVFEHIKDLLPGHKNAFLFNKKLI